MQFELASQGPDASAVLNILSVADNRTCISKSELTAVRLMNGLVIPTNRIVYPDGTVQNAGFTVSPTIPHVRESW